MKNPTQKRFSSDVNNGIEKICVREPLKLGRENQRRYIRVEITSPMSLRRIKDIFGNYWPTGDDYRITGSILNISAGGVLVEMDQPLNDGDIVAMRISLKDVEALEGVLGVVKRCDQDEDCYLAGIEFVNREGLADRLTQSEMEFLSPEFSNFDQTVEDVLSRYVYRGNGS